VFFTNLDPKLKVNIPPIIMTIRKQMISLVLKEKGRSFILSGEEDFLDEIKYPIKKYFLKILPKSS